VVPVLVPKRGKRKRKGAILINVFSGIFKSSGLTTKIGIIKGIYQNGPNAVPWIRTLGILARKSSIEEFTTEPKNVVRARIRTEKNTYGETTFLIFEI
tara:strand:- start:179649 stop:179942 length:294 start_codon:yes stop_codon:yes gene_type:complete